jgi:hypothetical protein
VFVTPPFSEKRVCPQTLEGIWKWFVRKFSWKFLVFFFFFFLGMEWVVFKFEDNLVSLLKMFARNLMLIFVAFL